MLQIELYNQSSELYSLSFLQQRRQQLLIICPGPEVADAFRSKIVTDLSCDVITISKFISDEFKRAFPANKIARKADILLDLGTAFKKFFPENSYETFFTVFDSFSELRSFTTDINLVEEVLDEYPELVAKAIRLFWYCVDEANLVDEHKSYSLLSEAYRSIEHDIHPEKSNITISKNIVFWGFNHLSAGQVDLLKAMSIRHDVYVPCAAAVYASSTHFDWIRWLAPDCEVGKVTPSQECRYVYFTKGRMGEAIRSYPQKAEKVFLALRGAQFNHFNEIPYGDIVFKSAEDIFESKFLTLKEEACDYFSEKEDYLLEEVRAWIEKKITQTKKDFRFLKVCILFKEILEQYRSLSEINEVIRLNDLKLLFHIINLNLPRTFTMPYVERENSVVVRGIEALETFDEEEVTFVCASSDYPSLLGSENRYSETMMAFLKEIGPVRRSEFIFEMIKFQLVEILGAKKTVLFIENGIRDHDLAWDKILKGFETETLISIKGNVEEKRNKYFFNIEKSTSSKRLSATRLQSYLDCPRQYYYKYVDSMQEKIQLKEKILPFEIGELEHDIIDSFFTQQRSYDYKELTSFAEKKIRQLMTEKELDLTKLDFDSYLFEVVIYCSNGLQVLYRLREIIPEMKVSFEVPLAKKDVTGRIDCLIEIKGKVGIIDFKRSSSSVPSKGEIERFNKIQTWFYMNHIERDVLFSGFLNLSDPEESVVIAFEDEYLDIFSNVGIAAKKITDVNLEDYRRFEQDIRNKMSLDSTYSPLPIDTAACSFCIIKNICPRLEATNASS